VNAYLFPECALLLEGLRRKLVAFVLDRLPPFRVTSPGFFAVITGQFAASVAFSLRYSDHLAGRSSWLKIAPTGDSVTHAPQSMPSSGLIVRNFSHS